MSQLATIPEVSSARPQSVSRTVMLAVALVSFASLLLELALTRLFSVVLFYHFAFFAISVALLGMGSGGVFAHVRREWLQKFAIGTLGGRLCILNSICILASVEAVLHTPVALEVSGRNFAKLTVIYLAATVPFFFTGLLFSTLFARSSSAISHLYGADLAGGSVACLAVVPLMNLVRAPNALLLSGLAMAAAAALWAGQSPLRRTALAVAVPFVLPITPHKPARLGYVCHAQ